MTAATYTMVCDAGADLSLQLTWKDSNGNAMNLSGYSAKMLIKRRYEDSTAEAVLTLTNANGRITLGGSAGTITLNVPGTSTKLTGGRYIQTQTPPVQLFYYDLELTSGAGAITRLLQGEFHLRAEISTE